MHDRVELFELFRIAEHNAAEPSAIKTSVGLENVGSKFMRNGGQHRTAYGNDLARYRVSVDDDGAQFGKPLRNRRFS